MGKTITEKILSRVTGSDVSAGDIIYPEPELLTVHDWYVVNFDKALQELGVERLYNPDILVISTDHEPVAVSPQAAERQKLVREIVKKYGIKNFFDAGRGGHGHVFPVEMGFVKPGMFVEAYDVHVTNFGAVGALAIPVLIEITEVLACGSVWLRTPDTVRVNLTGALSPGTSIRDVAQKLICDLGAARVDYAVVEFGGPALASIDIAGRHILCNTPIEVGVKSALIEPDQSTLDYLAGRVDGPIELIASDPDAVFREVIDYDLDVMEPQVAVPPTPDCVVGVSEVAGRPVHHAFIGSCAAANLSDLQQAAAILRGHKIHPDVRFIITPGTQEIMAAAEDEGLLRLFAEAGAMITQPGCGPCAGGRIGGMANGETSINTGTRNDYGRLGAPDADIYLGSSATVMASAVAGKITDPREFLS
ncbi:MAG: 3-isopropylmalate dehydratase large subunit [Rhodospirillaceae bacterium]|jgi:3-isopropylmalate/(R)-2-methylmalate dehydratase large subunit|nr:3-isopropylmalate dehydratase large subunit [Rhodospirillaceae bacterium]MBT6537198.1 3-isopropylmalate dehydratase large subunit [Rhodospirillaceae bacterium]